MSILLDLVLRVMPTSVLCKMELSVLHQHSCSQTRGCHVASKTEEFASGCIGLICMYWQPSLMRVVLMASGHCCWHMPSECKTGLLWLCLSHLLKRRQVPVLELYIPKQPYARSQGSVSCGRLQMFGFCNVGCCTAWCKANWTCGCVWCELLLADQLLCLQREAWTACLGVIYLSFVSRR
jgi:hypothetical protein